MPKLARRLDERSRLLGRFVSSDRTPRFPAVHGFASNQLARGRKRERRRCVLASDHGFLVNHRYRSTTKPSTDSQQREADTLLAHSECSIAPVKIVPHRLSRRRGCDRRRVVQARSACLPDDRVQKRRSIFLGWC